MSTQLAKKTPVRIGIVGTGSMAHYHAMRYAEIKGCALAAAVDVDAARAEEFAKKHHIPHVYPNAEAMMASGEVDAVSVVVPDAFHAEVATACLKAKGHVLCEKPLALNYPQAAKMVKAAQQAGTINMVNFSYRDMPSLQAVAALVRAGTLGEIRHVEASYLQAWLVSKVWGDWRTNPTWLWRLSSAHGSKGVLGDVGVHILDFATYPVGPLASVYCKLKTFDKAPGNRIGEYVLDANDSASMTVEFANGALGTIHTSRWIGGHSNRLHLKISGTLGSAEIDSDWGNRQYRVSLGRQLDKSQWKTRMAPLTPNNYTRFVRGIRSGVQDQPDFARGARVQRLLDACFLSDQKGRPIAIPAETEG